MSPVISGRKLLPIAARMAFMGIALQMGQIVAPPMSMQ